MISLFHETTPLPLPLVHQDNEKYAGDHPLISGHCVGWVDPFSADFILIPCRPKYMEERGWFKMNDNTKIQMGGWVKKAI